MERHGSRRDERRAHRRYTTDLAAVCVVVRSRSLAPGTRVPGRVAALSAGGFAFHPAAPLAAGDLVRLVMRRIGIGIEAEAAVLPGAEGPWISARFMEDQHELARVVAVALGVPRRLDAA